MRSDTFENWLRERGCTFEQTERGEGHPVIVVRRGGRRAELHRPGSNDDIDPDEIQRVTEVLGLDWSDLPGPQSRT